MSKFGGNEFDGVSVPLIFEGRYFILINEEKPLISVIVKNDDKFEFEIVNNKPVKESRNDISTNPTGIVTVSNRETGSFMYKVRPGSETSVTFGTLKGEELDVKIDDKSITVGTNKFGNNRIGHMTAGVTISKDGGIGFGSPIPQEILPVISTILQNI